MNVLIAAAQPKNSFQVNVNPDSAANTTHETAQMVWGEPVPLATILPVDSSANEARTCMQRIQEESRAPSEIIEVTMILIDHTSKSRTRKVTFYQKSRTPNTMSRLIRFHTPAELAGATILALENLDRSDDWWIFAPSYHMTRRIPSRNRSDTFLGTDLSYEDITDLRLDHYTFRFTGVDTIRGKKCRLLEAIPVDSLTIDSSRYARIVYWVDMVQPLYHKAVLYDHDNRITKEVHNSLAITEGGQWRWDRTEVIDIRKNHRTIIEVINRSIGVDLPDRIFTERGMRRSG